jgi:hypothetical protein
MATRTSALTDVETDPTAVVTALVGAGLLGLYAAWIAADFLPRWFTVGLVVLGAGYGLLRQETPRPRLQNALYVLAGLLLLTPVFLVLPDAVNADAFGVGVLSIVFTTMNVVVFLAFALVAALVAGAAYQAGETA